MDTKTVRIVQLSDEQMMRIIRGMPVFLDNQRDEIILICGYEMSKEEIIADAKEQLGEENVIVMGENKLDG